MVDLEPFFLPFNTSDSESGLTLSYRLLKTMGGLLSYSHGEKEMIFTVSLPKKASNPSEINGLSVSG
jgi:C4-dicarboxylate-specific signal transduction histidine kinase